MKKIVLIVALLYVFLPFSALAVGDGTFEDCLAGFDELVVDYEARLEQTRNEVQCGRLEKGGYKSVGFSTSLDDRPIYFQAMAPNDETQGKICAIVQGGQYPNVDRRPLNPVILRLSGKDFSKWKRFVKNESCEYLTLGLD